LSGDAGLLHPPPLAGRSGAYDRRGAGKSEFVERIRADLGLNDPIWVQYLDFLGNVARFDFGESYVINRNTSVREVLSDTLPVTLELALYGQLFGILFGIPPAY